MCACQAGAVVAQIDISKASDAGTVLQLLVGLGEANDNISGCDMAEAGPICELNLQGRLAGLKHPSIALNVPDARHLAVAARVLGPDGSGQQRCVLAWGGWDEEPDSGDTPIDSHGAFDVILSPQLPQGLCEVTGLSVQLFGIKLSTNRPVQDPATAPHIAPMQAFSLYGWRLSPATMVKYLRSESDPAPVPLSVVWRSPGRVTVTLVEVAQPGSSGFLRAEDPVLGTSNLLSIVYDKSVVVDPGDTRCCGAPCSVNACGPGPLCLGCGLSGDSCDGACRCGGREACASGSRCTGNACDTCNTGDFCGPSCSPCQPGYRCATNGGSGNSCQPCVTNDACGPGCLACAPDRVCSDSGTGCVECNNNVDCPVGTCSGHKCVCKEDGDCAALGAGYGCDDFGACNRCPAGSPASRPKVQMKGGTVTILGTAVQVNPFSLDTYLVTNGAFGSTPCGASGTNKPVACVTWQQARSYCTNHGGRLPTEREFAYAVGTQRYAWGGPTFDASRLCGGNSPGRSCDVGSFGKTLQGRTSCFGLADLTGNLYQWLDAAYTWPANYIEDSPLYDTKLDPPSPGYSGSRVLRGGAWGSSGCPSPGASGTTPSRERCFQSTFRRGASASQSLDIWGFRCAYD